MCLGPGICRRNRLPLPHILRQYYVRWSARLSCLSCYKCLLEAKLISNVTNKEEEEKMDLYIHL